MDTKGAAHCIDMAVKDNYYKVKRGGGTFDIRSDVHAKKDFTYYLEYGHSTLSINPSFSIGTGGASFSISFSNGVSRAGSDSGTYTIK